MVMFDIIRSKNVCSPIKSAGASAALFGLVVVGRAAFIFPLSFLFNFTKKSESSKLNLKQQVNFFKSIQALFGCDKRILIMTYTGHNLVGWSNERRCFNGVSL